MAPILGIIASANQGQYISYNSYESIATVTVGAGGSSTITFSSIPSTYKTLQIRGIARSNRGSGSDSAKIQVGNGSLDTGANYSYHVIYGTGSSAVVSNATSNNSGYVDTFAAASAGSNVFGGAIIEIIDYANTNKNKTIRSLGGYDNNGSGLVALASDAWYSTSAINIVTITPNVGSSWDQYSSFALYGIK